MWFYRSENSILGVLIKQIETHSGEVVRLSSWHLSFVIQHRVCHITNTSLCLCACMWIPPPSPFLQWLISISTAYSHLFGKIRILPTLGKFGIFRKFGIFLIFPVKIGIPIFHGKVPNFHRFQYFPWQTHIIHAKGNYLEIKIKRKDNNADCEDVHVQRNKYYIK